EPDVEQLEADGRHDEKIHPCDQVLVVSQEGDPALGPGSGSRAFCRYLEIAAASGSPSRGGRRQERFASEARGGRGRPRTRGQAAIAADGSADGRRSPAVGGARARRSPAPAGSGRGRGRYAESRPQETLRATSHAGFCSSPASKWSLNLASQQVYPLVDESGYRRE